MWIAGIDPSLRQTAATVGDGAEDYTASFRSQPGAVKPPDGLTLDSVAARMLRAEKLVGEIMAWLERRKIERIYLEGYAFGAQGSGGNHLIEFAGLLRWHLCDLTVHIREVAPATLKKFVTGAGNAKKNMMGYHVAHRWGVTVANDDEVDAYGLYRLGLVCEQLEAPENNAQAEAADTVLGRRGTKRKAKPKKRPRTGATATLPL